MLPDMARALDPRSNGPDGPLPLLLLGLTLLTGLVDAFSYLVLGHVFVANMTGNVVFLGFALAGVGGFNPLASLAALLAFGLGALACGAVVRRAAAHRARALLAAASTQWILLALATTLWFVVAGQAADGVGGVLVIALLAGAMGVQNHVARHLRVADLTTTVLTLTLTGLFADQAARGSEPGAVHQGRRLLSIVVMALGAFIGALLVVQGSAAWILTAALVLLGAIVLTAAAHRRSDAAWVRA